LTADDSEKIECFLYFKVFYNVVCIKKSTNLYTPSVIINREKMFSSREVNESRCIMHGHTCSGTSSWRFGLKAFYTGCSCVRIFGELRSYSPANPNPVVAFYDIGDVHHAAAASRVASDVAKECLEIVCNGEDVDIEFICELAYIAADDAMNVHAAVAASAISGDAQQHVSAVKDAARAAAYTVSVAFAVSIAKASRTNGADRLDAVLYTSDDSGECVVCSEICSDRLSCAHIICRGCVSSWLGVCTSFGYTPTCPICRNPLCHDREAN